MARLPPSPELDWRDDGTPVARAHDDIYFSAEDGLAETRAVFLEGCGLPAAWAGQQRFTVAETGFGTGLNFLALWQLWRDERPSAQAWLHFVSFEGFPLRKEDAARALGAWPELRELAERLQARWPHGAKGVRHLTWPGERVSLTLHVGDIRETLPDAMFAADAWFLDGFSPAKNDAMWGEWIYPEIAARSRRGARLGTFTVAGRVRRGLSDAGFDVSKAPGHGRKRDRLEAIFRGDAARAPDIYALRGAVNAAKRVAVVGGGIAGTSAARAFLDAGADVTLFDAAGHLAAGASGNPLALVMPRLDAGDTVQARLLVDAYLSARATYRGLAGTDEITVQQHPRNDRDAERFAKVLADPPLPLEDLEALRGGGLLHKRALVVRPAELIPALVDGAEVRVGELADLDTETRAVNGEAFDAVVLASGMAAGDVFPWLGLVGRLGQVEHVGAAAHADPSAIASGHYALSAGPDRLWGATFEAADGPPLVSDTARAANAEALETLDPWWRAQVSGAKPRSRAGVRATTPDRLPLIGAAVDANAMRAAFAGLGSGQRINSDAPTMEGIYLAAGFGARGFTWGPWAGAILAAQGLGGPSPAPRAALEAVSPARLIIRALKRGL